MAAYHTLQTSRSTLKGAALWHKERQQKRGGEGKRKKYKERNMREKACSSGNK